MYVCIYFNYLYSLCINNIYHYLYNIYYLLFQTYADKASANANDIRMEANKTKIAVLRLGNEAEKLHLRVDTTDSMMRQYEIQIAKDANVTAEVKI